MASDTRSSSVSYGYTVGDLSVYPTALDTHEQLFNATNGGSTRLSAPVSFESEVLPCKDTSVLPSQGLVVIDKEVIFYKSKGPKFLSGLTRGYSGKRSSHDINSEVKAAVCSDHHNSIRDAIIKIENKVGLQLDSNSTSTVYGRLLEQELKFLSLRAVFAAWPQIVQPGELVSFRDWSQGSPVNWLWDFGDGINSTEQCPHHRYPSSANGEMKTYEVSLTITDIRGFSSTVKKTAFIQVGTSDVLVYVTETTYLLGSQGVQVTFIDQTPGVITKRSWSFGDGGIYISSEPAENIATHTYRTAGTYKLDLTLETPSGLLAGPRGSNSIVITVSE